MSDLKHIHNDIIDNPDFNLTVAAKRDLRELCAWVESYRKDGQAVLKAKDAEIVRLNKRHENFLQEFWATNAENQRLKDALERVAQLHGGNFAVRDIAREALQQVTCDSDKHQYEMTDAEAATMDSALRKSVNPVAATKQEDEG